MSTVADAPRAIGGETLGSRLAARDGIGPGFDHLRVGLSLAILFWHSFGISYGIAWTRSDPTVAMLRPLLAMMLPMFFALSGFLVMGSALRINDLRTFITFRVLRILPALAAEISLSALILGPLVTVLPLSAYFADPRFFEYFGSLIGRVKYVLPGLFVNTPTPEVVNGALWTVGPEITCYIVMALLILTTVYRSGRGIALFSLAFVLVCVASDSVLPPEMFEILPTKALVLAFLASGLIYHYRDRVPYSLPLAIGAGAGAVVLIALAQMGGPLLVLMYPAVLLAAYLTVFIGLTDLPPLPFFHRGDYSYGIYIFGFPIQQSIAHFLPAYQKWWVNFGLTLPIVLVFAVASWHLIEKPVLKLRKPILAGRAPRMPVPPSAWQRREWGLAALLLVYGAFVSYHSGVFPLKRVVAHLTSAGGATAVQPPPGI